MNVKCLMSNVKCPMSNVKCPMMVGVFLILFMLHSNPAIAASATASAKVSPQPSASGSASLIQKINEIKEKAASKAADFISQVTKKLQNKAYYGIINSVDDDKIVVSFQDKDFTIVTDEYTGFTSALKTGKKIAAVKDLAKGDFIAALGDTDDKGVLNAKKIIKSAAPASESAQLIWGQVQKIAGPTITISNSEKSDQVITAAVKSSIFLGQEEASLVDIKAGRTIIARGKMSANSGFFSSYIYIIPPTADAKPEKNGSAMTAVTVSASPSASPKNR